MMGLMTPDRVNQNPVRMNQFEWSDEGVSEFDGYEAAANWILNFL
jgi:hypothetical protein